MGRFVKFCAQDIRPFNSVSGSGFLDLAQFFLDCGAQHGKIDARELLPSRVTISRHVHQMASELRTQIKPELETCLKVII